MPKKPNSSGELQEYVPAGNGDASGEYGDADGNNRHFTSWKNPHTEESGIADVVGEKPTEVETKQDGFAEYLQKNHNNDFGKRVERDYNAGNAEAQALTNELVSKHGVTYKQVTGKDKGYFNPLTNEVCLKGTIINSGDEGETFYHETWHAADFCLIKDRKFVTEEEIQAAKAYIGNTSKSKDVLLEQAKAAMYVSCCKRLSNGKTLLQTIGEEFAEMRKNRTWEQIVQDLETAKTITIEEPEGYQEAKRHVDEQVQRLTKEARELYPYYNFETGKIDEKAFEKQEKYKTMSIQKDAKLSNDKELVDNYGRKLEEARSKATLPFANLSDMYVMATKKTGFWGGHSVGYAKHAFSKAVEFIAEYGSAKARKTQTSQKELDLFNRYMPKSSQACEELQDLIIKHMGVKS